MPIAWLTMRSTDTVTGTLITVSPKRGTLPAASITSPGAGATWRTGDTIAFTGEATDFQGNPITGASLSWRVNLRHCNRLSSNCHTHVVQSLTGAGGSVVAPVHEYPSYLELELTATDSFGLARTVTRRLDPLTVPITLESSPPTAPDVARAVPAIRGPAK